MLQNMVMIMLILYLSEGKSGEKCVVLRMTSDFFRIPKKSFQDRKKCDAAQHMKETKSQIKGPSKLSIIITN